jgi:tRNA-splicing endonuclease subunit Sen2
MLSYVAYHHFRSLGWVVRAGTKFGVDFLLYNRGPVFSHAEFAIMIMPSYSHKFWQTEEGKRSRRIQEQKDWWWLHCVNRVQSQVKKSLVLCYVEIPPPVRDEKAGSTDVATLLKGYKVREFVIRRWLMNRSRG